MKQSLPRRALFWGGIVAVAAAVFCLQMKSGLALGYLLEDHDASGSIGIALTRILQSQEIIALALWYGLAGILVHAIIIALPLLAARDSIRRFSIPRRSAWLWGSLFALGFYLGLAALHSQLFPQSLAVPHIDLLLYQLPGKLWLWGFLGLYALMFAGWLLLCATRGSRIFALCLLVTLYFPGWITAGSIDASPTSRSPNVILVGIDSLRPDHLPLQDPATSRLMPELGRFLAAALIYSDVVTPLGRTFPALTSVMTGRYPTEHGARENLYPPEKIDLDWTLGSELQGRGYATAFAMDEARFANFTPAYGFDLVQTPPQGVKDFLFGTLIDTLGSNIATLFPAGRWLHPIGYGNRAAVASYRPVQFDRQLRGLIHQLPTSSSLLMVHFCLPHWPYSQAAPLDAALDPALPFETEENYARALHGVDGQFGSLLSSLEDRGFLDNAIVVVYSDHGESLKIEKDLAFREKYGIGHFDSVPDGHGTSIFLPSQNRVLLAIQQFSDGQAILPAGSSDRAATLIDIPRTVVGMLDGAEPERDWSHGRNLLENGQPTARIRYMESAMSSAYADIADVDEIALFNQFGSLFTLDENLNIIFSPPASALPIIIKEKGAIANSRVVGSTPRYFSQPAENAGNHRGGRLHWETVTWPTSTNSEAVTTDDEDEDEDELKARVCRFFSRDAEFMELCQ